MSSGTFYAICRHLHRIDDDSAQSNPMVRQWNCTPIIQTTYRHNPYLGNLPNRIIDDLKNHAKYRGMIRRIFVSPFLRCMQTALYLANQLDIDMITVDYRLAEFGRAIDPMRTDGTLSLTQIFDQSMEYIDQMARSTGSRSTGSRSMGSRSTETTTAPFDHHNVISDDDIEIFRSILYDDRGIERIKIVSDGQTLESINFNESMDEYSARLRNAIQSLQSDGTLFVTHSGGMLWKNPNRWMRYNVMYFYPTADSNPPVGSSLRYPSNKQIYMTLNI